MSCSSVTILAPPVDEGYPRVPFLGHYNPWSSDRYSSIFSWRILLGFLNNLKIDDGAGYRRGRNQDSDSRASHNGHLVYLSSIVIRRPCRGAAQSEDAARVTSQAAYGYIIVKRGLQDRNPCSPTLHYCRWTCAIFYF